MLIRTATNDDVTACLRLAEQEDEAYWTVDDFNEAIINKNAIFLVAGIDNQILGYVIGFIVPTKNTEAMLHETRVDLTSQGQKIGTKLVEAFCHEALRRAAKIVYALIVPELKPFYVNSCRFKKSGQWLETSKEL